MKADTREPELYELIEVIFAQRIPFNRLLGLEIESVEKSRATLRFEMREELVGNYMRRILHGGVTSATLDAAAGLVVYLSCVESMENESTEEKLKRFYSIATIDMRVDYLRPAEGEHFLVSAELLRAGNRIALARAELRNDRSALLAIATCTYTTT